MGQVFTMLIEGDKNPSDNDIAQFLLKKYDFTSKDRVTFWGKDEKTGEPVHVCFHVEEVGWFKKYSNQLRLKGCHSLNDEKPTVTVEFYNFEEKTGKMTYSFPEPKKEAKRDKGKTEFSDTEFALA